MIRQVICQLHIYIFAPRNLKSNRSSDNVSSHREVCMDVIRKREFGARRDNVYLFGEWIFIRGSSPAVIVVLCRSSTLAYRKITGRAAASKAVLRCGTTIIRRSAILQFRRFAVTRRSGSEAQRRGSGKEKVELAEEEKMGETNSSCCWCCAAWLLHRPQRVISRGYFWNAWSSHSGAGNFIIAFLSLSLLRALVSAPYFAPCSAFLPPSPSGSFRPPWTNACNP